jgi:muramidase (phage lysozyme)
VTPNVAAFLAMIAHSEGTDRAPDPYRVCFAFKHTIADLRDHPAVTGEWKGEPLPDELCIKAGFSPGCVSTAAGKYQITRPTWNRVKGILRLANFTGPSQDDACVQLIKERGALDIVNGGQVAAAIGLCHTEWASLPGSTSGQPQTSFADLIQAYGDAGGAFA